LNSEFQDRDQPHEHFFDQPKSEFVGAPVPSPTSVFMFLIASAAASVK
jgi:hypothetical protein